MCNRFRQAKPSRELAEHFQAWGEVESQDEIEDTPRFNIAPTQPILTVRKQAGKRMISSMRWGLVPARRRRDRAPGTSMRAGIWRR